MMNKIDNSGQGLAKLGRDEDQYMAHVAQGEMVVPPIISPETRARIEAEMKAVGLSPDEYTVGAGMSINPITGMPEFGWLKKTFKSVKKVVKKAAPILGPAAMLIPGVGPAISGALGSIGGGIVTGLSKIPGIGGALSSGASAIGRGIGALTGIGGGTAGTAAKTGGNLFGRIKEFVLPGTDKVGLFGNVTKGIGSFFGGGMGGQPAEIDMSEYTPVKGIPGAYMDKNGNIVTEQDIIASQTTGGGFLGGKSPLQFLSSKLLPQSVENVLGTGPGGGGLGSLISGAGGGGMGGGLGAAALAGLLGKITYESAKERMGGLAETPAVTMDALGRYQLSKELGTGGTRGEFGLGPAPKALEFAGGGLASTRQYFNMGGVAELDMRDGGESAGPGTGTSDDIPAMLSDGEYVMTAKATRGAGAFNVKKNKSGIELVQGGKPSRKKGVENMRKLMDIFEAI